MKKIIEITALASIMMMLFYSCSKDEGEGGMATITGKVYEAKYNHDFSVFIEENVAANEDVYIIYGDDITYSDNVNTNYDGTYSFEFLRPGEYTIFVYSDDPTGASLDNIAITKKVTIDGKKDILDVDDILISNSIDYNDGTSSIYGKVWEVVKSGPYTIVDEYYVPDEWVYIVYNTDSIYFDRVRTFYDGSYIFRDLIKGNYTVYTYSEDSTGTIPSGVSTVFKQAQITENGQQVVLSDFRILNL